MSTTAEHDSASVERDFDVYGDEYVQGAADVWKEMRAECPVAHSTKNGGHWLPTTWDDIAAVAYDPETFSSRDIGVAPAPEGVGLLVAPPITSDPPFHTDARRLLLPFFAPKPVEELVEVTRSIARERLDVIAAETGANEGRVGVTDAADSYSKHIPVRVIARIRACPSPTSRTSPAGQSTCCNPAATSTTAGQTPLAKCSTTSAI